MVSKFETTVRGFVYTSVILIHLFFTHLVEARELNSRNTDDPRGGACGIFAQAQVDACKNPTSPECQAAKDNYTNNCSTGNQTGCGAAEGNYQTALTAFGNACGQAGMPEQELAAGHVKCSFSMERCDKCLMSNPPSRLNCDNVNLGDSNNRDRAEPSSSRGGDMSERVERTTSDLSVCPSRLGANRERLQKEFDNVQKLTQELETKIPQLRTEIANLESTGREKIAEYNRELRQAIAEGRKQVREAQKNQVQRIREAQNQAAQLGNQVIQINNGIQQLRMSKVSHVNNYNQAIMGIQAQCNQQAAEWVREQQKLAIEQERAGLRQRGDFVSVLRNTGMSDIQQWEAVAKQRYEVCQRFQGTMDAKKLAQARRDEQFTQTDAGIRAQEEQRNAINQQISEIRGRNCGPVQQNADGTTSETEVCRAIREGAEEITEINNDVQEKQQEIQQNIERVTVDTQNKINVKNQELATLMLRQRTENARLDNLRQMVDAANRADGSSDPKAFGTVQGKYYEFKAAAEQLVGCRTSRQCTGPCQTAKKFFEAINRTVNHKEEEPQSTPAATEPPVRGTGPTPEAPNRRSTTTR